MKQAFQIEALSNEHLKDAPFSVGLTKFVAGIKPGPIDALLAAVAPLVETGEQRFEYATSGEGSFLVEADESDIRAPGGDFKVVKYSTNLQLAKTQNKGLRILLDTDRLPKNSVAREAKINSYTQLLLRRIKMADLLRALGAIRTVAGAAISHSWSGGTIVPDADVMEVIATVLTGSGCASNHILYGQSAWAKRLAYYESKANAAANLTPEALAGKLAVERIFVPKDIYDSGAGKTLAVQPNEIIAYVAVDSAMEEDPSTVKTFWTRCDDGEEYRVYRKDYAKTIEIMVEHYSLIAQTSTGTAKRLIVG